MRYVDCAVVLVWGSGRDMGFWCTVYGVTSGIKHQGLGSGNIPGALAAFEYKNQPSTFNMLVFICCTLYT